MSAQMQRKAEEWFHSCWTRLAAERDSRGWEELMLLNCLLARWWCRKARSCPLHLWNTRPEEVTSEKLCRAQHELHFQAATYLCLLRSVREHLALHQEYHSKGERSPEDVAGLVGLKLPQQPGGKGWEQ
uniref:Protein FMC1 homolog n=1 Tax=Geotrypetes seraphini TaxID=260995 RepID=A0A6P8QU40_GEOSA|nr:protein FMC1 homolog isoform X2 [Geotrypetes seraphini]